MNGVRTAQLFRRVDAFEHAWCLRLNRSCGQPAVRDIFAAISKLRAGQITDVVPLYDQAHKANGYAIYKLLDKEAAGQYELNDPRVQQTIRGQLRDSRSQLLRNAYDEMLRDQAHVENYYAEGIFKKGAQ